MSDGNGDLAAGNTIAELPELLADRYPPSYRGRAVDSAGLLALAREATAGDAESLALVDEIFNDDVIGELARLRRRDDLARLDARWRANVDLLPQLAQELGRPGAILVERDVARRVRAEVLTVLLDPNARDALEESADLVAAGYQASLRETASRLRTGGDEPVRLIAAVRALGPEKQRLQATTAQPAQVVDQKFVRTSFPTTGRDTERAARRRRRDRWIALLAIVLLAAVYPAAYLGELLSRERPLRDDGAVLLDDLGAAEPVVTSANWATGAIAILTATVILLCLRRRWRGHPLTLVGIVACGVAAAVLALLLPGMRDSTWEKTLARIGTAAERGDCTNTDGVAYTLGNGLRQPVLVGPAPLCQRISRLAQRRGETVWQRWIPELHSSRIHKFDSTLVLGGTYEGDLVAAGLAPLTGRVRWRRTCNTPATGGGEIGFSIVRSGTHRIGSVLLRCSDGRTLRVNAASGRRIPASRT